MWRIPIISIDFEVTRTLDIAATAKKLRTTWATEGPMNHFSLYVFSNAFIRKKMKNSHEIKKKNRNI